MGVFREEVSVLEYYAKNQKQIWSDAADHGYEFAQSSIPGKESADKLELREAIMSLMEACHYKFSRHDQGKDGHCTKTSIFVAWEIDEGKMTGTIINLEYYLYQPQNPSQKKEYLTITFFNARLSERELQSKGYKQKD